jgi:hypothetical protein
MPQGVGCVVLLVVSVEFLCLSATAGHQFGCEFHFDLEPFHAVELQELKFVNWPRCYWMPWQLPELLPQKIPESPVWQCCRVDDSPQIPSNLPFHLPYLKRPIGL